MNFNYIKTFIATLSIVSMCCLSSCIGDLDVSPIDPSVTQEFDQDAVFAKLYSSMALTGQQGAAGNPDLETTDEGFSAFYRLIFTLNEYPADQIHCKWDDEGIPEITNLRWSSNNGQIAGLYGRFNFNIAMCNHFLEMTDGASDEYTVKQRAEARFIRALNFFYNMDIFGNVPFTEVVTDDLPEQIKRADLFDYIEKELKEIEADMSEPRQGLYGRADKAAAWLLLARMYLNAEVYTGTARWADAITYANKTINSSYELCPVYKHLFMADNGGSSVNKAPQEIILPIFQAGDRIRNYGGSTFLVSAPHYSEDMTSNGLGISGWYGIRARASLAEKFFTESQMPIGNETEVAAKAGDDRALFHTKDRTYYISNVAEFTEGISIAKWKNIRADKGQVTDPYEFPDVDIPFFRLAEAYLILAEASLRNGDGEATALQAVNVLRERANTSRLATIKLDDVLDERAREFYFEGHRRMDLVRYGYFTSNGYLWDWKGGVANGTGVNSHYNLYPIPVSDLIANEKLVQNPGY